MPLMLRIMLVALLGATVIVTGACSPQGSASIEPCADAQPADAVLRSIIDADNARDIDAALDGYTDDIVWLPPGRPPLAGINAIRESYEKMYSAYRPSLSISIDETLADQRLAMVRGATHGKLTPQEGSPIAVDDNFLAILQCDSGAWRVARMIWGPAGAE